MAKDAQDATKLAESGWRQGSVLPVPLVDALIMQCQVPMIPVMRHKAKSGVLGRLITAASHALERHKIANRHFRVDSDRWVVVSQDCDLLNNDWSKEPHVELLLVQEARTTLLPPAWGQSPREIQFSDPPGDKKSPKFVSCIHDRSWIDRKYLIDYKPDQDRIFDPENIRRLCRWIARRYVRAAFPDEFNNRVKGSLDALTKRKSELNKNSELLSGIYMRVPDGELPPGKDYEIIVWGAMRTVDFENPEKATRAQQLLNLVEATLGSCDGIDIKESELKSEQDITIDHLREWKRWDFDVLSLRPKRKNDPLPPVDEMPREA